MKFSRQWLDVPARFGFGGGFVDYEEFWFVGAIGVLGSIFVELLEEVHYFDERMIVGDVFCVAVRVVAFAIQMNCF